MVTLAASHSKSDNFPSQGAQSAKMSQQQTKYKAQQIVTNPKVKVDHMPSNRKNRNATGSRPLCRLKRPDEQQQYPQSPSPPRTAHARFIMQKNREALLSERGPRANINTFYSRGGVSGAATAAVTTRERMNFTNTNMMMSSKQEPFGKKNNFQKATTSYAASRGDSMPTGSMRNPWGKFNLDGKTNIHSDMAGFEDSVFSVKSGTLKEFTSPR